MKLTFLGAVETVTGSKYLLESGSQKILIDCGLFQGYKELRLRNWSKFPVNPSQINSVLLTHAHIDHSGYIPLFIKNGFKGKIYCTEGTYELCKILLPDSGFLQEEEAHFANKYGYSKHSPALPLYTADDAKRALKQFEPCDFAKNYTLPHSELHFQFQSVGHILGASMIILKEHQASITFSGDVGRLHDPLMCAPKPIKKTDYLVLESTYGNRLHDKTDPMVQLGEIINRTVSRGGSVIMPAFAVGRAQNILYYIHQLKSKHLIPDLPVFLDSPMAVSATELFCRYQQEHCLTKEQCQSLNTVATYVNSIADSKNIDRETGSKIIISASGMATGGRVLHHIKVFGRDKKNTLLFTGYQAGGTRGDRMVRGEKQIKLLGEIIEIRAEVLELKNMSAHADYEEMLTWLKSCQSTPRKVFLTHGEPEAALALKQHIESVLKWPCIIPTYLQKVEL